MPQSLQQKKQVMTIKEVADYLGVHTSTVYRYAQAGQIPAFKIGSDWRFSRRHIDDWIDEETRRNGDAQGRQVGQDEQGQQVGQGEQGQQGAENGEEKKQ